MPCACPPCTIGTRVRPALNHHRAGCLTGSSGAGISIRTGEHDNVLKALCATIMGFAICSMHYVAMFAVSYTPMPETPDSTNAVSISTVANTAIIAVTFVVLGSVFLFQRWFPAQAPARSKA